MPTETSKKCAHVPCACMASESSKYCSDSCQDAGAEEVEIDCPCGHPACATRSGS
jgi:hypothetical protein